MEAARWWPGRAVDGVTDSAWPVGVTCARGCPWTSPYFFIRTLNGPVHICPGDWVIHGVTAGDVYPCPDEVFRATYEPTD